MNATMRRGIRTALVCLLAGTATADWPQFRGPDRDGRCAETGLLDRWPEGGPRRLWTISNLGRGWSSPIFVAHRMVITGDVDGALRVFAFDEKRLGPDAKPIWTATNGRAWDGPYRGSRPSPTHSEGALYLLNAHGRLACLDAEKGTERWAVDTQARFGSRRITWGKSECLLVDGDRVIVTPGGRKAAMAALDKRTGKTVWASEPIPGDDASYASPILFRHGGLRHLVGFTSAHALGVDADSGRLLWTRPRETRHRVLGSMAVFHEGTLFLTGPDGQDAELVRLTVEGRTVRTERIWTSKLNNLTGGVIRIADTYYGSGYRWNDGLFAVDAKTGAFTCEKRDQKRSALLLAEGLLYALAESGDVFLLKPSPKAFETRGRFSLPGGQKRDAWAHPVIHEGRLYLRYHDTLWCHAVNASSTP